MVAYQILKCIMGERFATTYGNMKPAEFLEHICCSNYGKFTLHVGDGKTNYDYAGDEKILKHCHEYIKADIIIMPKSMYEGAVQKQKLLLPFYPDILVFPVYQTNARVVNCVIHRNLNKDKNLPPNYKYAEVEMESLTQNERLWHENIKKIKHNNFKSIYVYCKDIIDDCRRIQQYSGACNHIYVDIFLHRSAEECFWKDPVKNLVELITYFKNGGI